MARRYKRPQFSLREAQQRMAALNDRSFRGKGPVSNLPVPDTTGERITADELAEDDQEPAS